MRLALILTLLIAGCAAEPEPPVPMVGFRNHAVPISSTTRGGPEDMAGNWVVGPALAAGAYVAPGAAVRIDATGDDWRWTISPGGVTFTAEITLPGRYRFVGTQGTRGAAGAPELWVLWVDDDFRTAVIGTPDGTAGWIMNRPGQASGDRTRAAQEILDFNGYTLVGFAG